MAFKPHRIIWHHSADAVQGPQLKKINAYHKARGFPLSSLGFYVGYHYLIERDGTVVQCRSDQEIGSHDSGENIDSIGVCLAGNFDIEDPSWLQISSFIKLLETLLVNHHIGFSDVRPHRNNDSTACPGKRLSDIWPLQQLVAQKLRDIDGISKHMLSFFT